MKSVRPVPPESAPLWLLIMRRWDGVRELVDGALNPIVRKMFEYTHYPKSKVTDTTPWCAAAVSQCLEVSGVKSTFSAGAVSYETWGIRCEPERLGAICIMKRHDPKNPNARHVGFSEGLSPNGKLLLRGGNQRNCCCVEERDLADVVTARWPEDED